MIDKIKCKNKYGSDSHKYLIALLKQAQIDTSVFPETCSEEDYAWLKKHYLDEDCPYPDWYIGLIGFSSFGSKFFDTYPRGFKADKTTPRDMVNEAIRNIIKQSPKLKGIHFSCLDYRNINPIQNFVIYCDPPYKGTMMYKGTDLFDYEEFYDWCRKMAENNTVLISEYNMPTDFQCIWQKELRCTISSNAKEPIVLKNCLYVIRLIIRKE